MTAPEDNNETQATASASTDDAGQKKDGETQDSSVVYDNVEKSLGIGEYMSPTVAGFSAVMKARYSDFVVHEVAIDGAVARLTSTEVPRVEAPPESPAPTNETSTNEEKNSEQTPQNCDLPALKSELQSMINDESIAEHVVSMLDKHNKNEACEEKFVTLPALEKPERKAIHGWIREKLTVGRADTLEGRIRIWHKKFETEMPNYKLFGNNSKKRGNNDRDGRGSNKKSRKDWPEDRPKFLRFVLYKENMDTTTATKDLSRKAGKARIGYGGMKDKRGITSQFCTMFMTEPGRIVGNGQAVGGGNTKQRGYGVVQVGNFEYVSSEMRLGTLKGNRFDLVLRNVQAGADMAEGKKRMEDAASTMKQFGFINYFGTQRFGKYKDTHLVGIEVLKGNYEKAIDIIMQPKPDDRSDVAVGRTDWHNRFQAGKSADNEMASAKRVMKSLNRFMTAENSAMQILSRFPLGYRKAFTAIPKTLRMMYLHAVQSLVWNRAVSHRINLSRTDALVGDLVRKGDGVQVVTEEDAKDKRFSIEDVVLPLIGTKSQLPTNEMGDIMKNLFSKIEVSFDMFKQIKDKDLAIYGDYRNIMCRLSDLDFEIKEYYDPKQPLLQTDLMKMKGEDITITPPEDGQEKKVAMIVGFTLPSSSYATIAIRELLKRPTSTDYQKDLKL